MPTKPKVEGSNPFRRTSQKSPALGGAFLFGPGRPRPPVAKARELTYQASLPPASLQARCRLLSARGYDGGSTGPATLRRAEIVVARIGSSGRARPITVLGLALLTVGILSAGLSCSDGTASTTVTVTTTITAAPTATATTAAPTTTTTAPTTTTAAPTTTTTQATTIVNGVVIQPSYQVVQALGEVHALDSPGGVTVETFEQLNVLEVVTTLLVIGPEHGRGPVWYEVRLPCRPNGSTGWVSSDEVSATWVSTAIVVQLDNHRLTLCDQGREVANYPICVGTAINPTPTGAFYVIGVLKNNPSGAYGPYAIGTSAFSETLTDWPYGGVVGIHGTNNPSSIGRSMSHGCIRLNNRDITQLAQKVSLGTPIFIVP